MNGTVRALLASGGNVYIGGSFTTVGGVAHKNMAEVNGTSGALVPAFANTTRPNKMVRAFVQIGGNLYVGGAFTSPRSYLMEVNATNNTYIPTWQPVVDGEVHALATDMSRLAHRRGRLPAVRRRIRLRRPHRRRRRDHDGRLVRAVRLPRPADVHPAPGLPVPAVPDPRRSRRTGTRCSSRAPATAARCSRINIEDGTVNWRAGFNGNVVGAGVTDGVVYAGGHYSTYCGPINGNNFVCDGLPGLGVAATS